MGWRASAAEAYGEHSCGKIAGGGPLGAEHWYVAACSRRGAAWKFCYLWTLVCLLSLLLPSALAGVSVYAIKLTACLRFRGQTKQHVPQQVCTMSMLRTMLTSWQLASGALTSKRQL